MLRHFFKIAYRNILRKGKMSLLNIAGLSLGIASFIVISLYVFQETSYEQGHERAEDLYRIEEHFLSMGQVAWTNANLQFNLDEIPEIEAFARVRNNLGASLLIDSKAVKVGRMLTSDNRFFELFNYELLLGDTDKPLTGPGSAVISQQFAETLFGRSDIVGENLKVKNVGDVIISAVMKDAVRRSHLDFDLMLHFSPEEKPGSNWYGIGGYTYIRTSPGSTVESLNAKLDGVVERNVFPTAFKPTEDMSFEDWMAHENRIQFMVKPLGDIYLYSKLKFEMGAGGDSQMLVTLSIIAVFILIIASINFMNLTTARSSGRTKEIGVRKVLGSRKKSLVFQFLSESVLITLVSAVIAAGLSELIIYLVNNYFGDIIGISLFSYPIIIALMFVGVLLIGVLSGLYPAFYLSSARVIPLLKGMKLTQVLNVNVSKVLRNGLVVTQFTLSTGMIIATLFIYNQLMYMKGKDLGFSEDNVMVVTNAQDLGASKQAFRNELLNIPGIKSVSLGGRVPGDGSNSIQSVMLDANESISFQAFTVDDFYKETLDLSLQEGEWFRPELVKSDSNVIVNRAAVETLGLTDPVGTLVGNYYRIIGVMEDFQFASFRNEIGPAVFQYSESKGNRAIIKLNMDKVPYQAIEDAWGRFSSMPLETKMLEQNFDELLYKEEQSANTVLGFTVLAILISCLGLFGLAAFIADQRQHEFGVRKVLGATVGDVVKLFSFDFLKLIGIAFLISVPVAIWAVGAWLQGYAERVSMSAGVFVLAGILAITIAFLTILFQSLKTGKLNPVDTLRSE